MGNSNRYKELKITSMTDFYANIDSRFDIDPNYNSTRLCDFGSKMAKLILQYPYWPFLINDKPDSGRAI